MKKTSVTILGTCRVYQPCEILRDKNLIEVNNSGVYSFSHTTKETIQILKNMYGALHVDDGLVPLVSRNGLDPYRDQEMESSDVIVLEVSSRRLYGIGGLYFNTTFIREYFKDRIPKFEEWWRDLTKDRLNNDIEAYNSKGLPSLDDKTLSMLSDITCVSQTKKEFVSDMDEISRYFEKKQKVIVVSHFDVINKKTGVRIEEREMVAGWLEEYAVKKGYVFFNPRIALEMYGEEGLQDYSHYTEEFKMFLSESLFNLIKKEDVLDA